LKKCTGPAMHVNYLLQDSVDENLHWKDSVDKNHPLYVVSEFIEKKFKHTDKSQPFNLGDKLIDLTKPPYGLYQSYAGMGMVAFAMRKYIKQIFDLNGKPRESQHLVDDIIEIFKTWEAGKQSNKLNFRFETKESRKLCESLIKQLKLTSLSGYNDISSLTDARWVITHEFSKKQGYPLWSLKYVAQLPGVNILPDSFKELIDNILKICGDLDMRNPLLINDTLNGIERYSIDLGNLLNASDSFSIGFNNYLRSIEVVNLQDNEIEEAADYLTKHLQETIGLWTEIEVSNNLKDWRMKKNEEERLRREEEDRRKKEEKRIEEEKKGSPVDDSGRDTAYVEKRVLAKNRVKQISSVTDAQVLLEKICEVGNETILDIINEYNV